MRNVCIVSECQQIPGVGGTETVSYILKEELKKNGYNVWSCYLIPKATPTDTDIQIPQMYNVYSHENITALIDTITKKQIETILIQGAPIKGLLELCIEAKKVTGVKLVYAYHFNPFMNIKEYDDYKERLLYKKSPIVRPFYSLYCELKRGAFTREALASIKNSFLKYDIENIDAFVSLNKEFTKFFQALYPQQFKERFNTIENPIVIDNDNDSYTNNKENIILFVGRLTYQKRLDRLLSIWKHLQWEFTDWKVVVVGNGTYAENYKKIVIKQQLLNVEFVGQVPSEKYFKKSKIFCLTSSHESFGMVLVEAQKYGCVPIAYNSFEAATEIIEDGHNGLLITPFKEKEYAKALRTLIINEEKRKFLVANGKKFISKFDSKKIIKEWIKLFDKIQ